MQELLLRKCDEVPGFASTLGFRATSKVPKPTIEMMPQLYLAMCRDSKPSQGTDTYLKKFY